MIFGGKQKKIEKLHNDAVAMFEAGNYEESVKRFAKLCDLEPNSERLYYLGVLMDMMGLSKEATKALQQSVRMDGQNSMALYSLAIVQQQSDNIEGAYDAIKKAYKADPNDFRILNLLAKLMITSPFEEHRDPKRAYLLAKRACELTNNHDEVCLDTLKEAQAMLGGAEDVDDASGEGQAHMDTTQRIIGHFEARFKRKANDRALQNIVPNAVPVAVQTIEFSANHAVAFTTGMSGPPMPVKGKKEIEYAELFMIIPASHKVPNPIDESIWPWHHLQILAFRPHSQGKCYWRKPQVIPVGEGKEPFAEGVEFVAYLLLPNVKGYVEPLDHPPGKRTDFILAMPIYREEYELATGEGGLAKLFDKIKATKTKPHYTPGRPNLAT